MQLIEFFENQHSCVVSARWERLACGVRVSRGTPLRCSFRCSIPGRLQWHIYWNFMQISKLFTQLQLLGSLAREQDRDSYIYVFVYIYREKETQTWCEVAGLPRCAFIFIKTESVTAIRKE